MLDLNFNNKFVIRGLVILLVVLHVWSLLRYPGIYSDEAWLISRAWAFNQTGHQFGPLDSGLEVNFPNYWIVNQWLITFLQGVFLKFTAVPALLPVRILSLLLGFGLAGINYFIGKKLGGPVLGYVSTILLTLSQAFFYSAHMARYDILAAFFCYLALACVIWDSKGRFWSGLIAGIILGLAIETHLNSLIFIPTIGMVYAFDYGWQVLRKAGVWGFAGGLTISAFYYLFLHVLPNPDTYFKMNALSFGSAYTPPILTLNAMKILNGFGESGMLFLVAGYSMVLLAIIKIFSILRTRNKNEVKILMVNFVLFLCMALIMPKKTAQYAILIAPAILWLVALFLIEFIKRPWGRKIWNYLYLALVLGIVIAPVLSMLLQIIPDNYQKYENTQAVVNTYIAKDDIIMGNQWYWLGLFDHQYYSWELLFLYPEMYPGKSLQDAFTYFHPTVLIIDQPLNEYIVDNLSPDSIAYSTHISKVEMDRFLSQHARLEGKFPSELFGTVMIYKIIGY